MIVYQIWETRYLGLGKFEEVALGDYYNEPFVKTEVEHMREQGRHVQVRVYEVTEQPKYIKIEEMKGYEE